MENITVNMENLTEEEREQLLALVKKGNKPKSKRWKPKYGEQYYTATGNNKVNYFIWENRRYDEECYYNLNCFRTKEEAEFLAEKRKVEVELKRFADEHNEEEIDWNCHVGYLTRYKYYICYKYNEGFISVGRACFERENKVYFTSEKIAKQAIQEIGEERLKKYYFEVED